MKKKQLRSMVLLGTLALSFMTFLGSVQNVQAEESSLQVVLDRGTLIVGIEAAYPPWESIDTETDEIVGFDPDIIAIVADDMGVDVEFVNIGWHIIFTSLAAGEFDCIISAVTITEEREQVMDFSRWYYRGAQAVMVTLANPLNISSVDDLDNASITIGCSENTPSHWYAQNNLAAMIITQTTPALAVADLGAGHVDAVLGDYLELTALLEGSPNTFQIVDTFQEEQYGIACQEGAISLVDAIDSSLNGLLGDNISNPNITTVYNDIHNEWLGLDAWGFEDYIPPSDTDDPTDDDPTDDEPSDDEPSDDTPSDDESTGDGGGFDFVISGFPLISVFGVIMVSIGLVIWKKKP
ncbi:MAG: ABC transporter substrate-binding protein [Promethearchaeota archaeon]